MTHRIHRASFKMPPPAQTQALSVDTENHARGTMELVPNILWPHLSIADIRSYFNRLLKIGEFADATIVCGKQTWEGHKAVVASRSEWFEEALFRGLKVTSFVLRFCFFPLGFLPCVRDVETSPGNCTIPRSSPTCKYLLTRN